MIIFINGPCGVGKTEVSSELMWMFDRGVMLDGDYLGAVKPFDIYDQQRIDYLYRTIQHVLAFHVKEGNYSNFVVNYVFETPESLAQLRGMLGEYDDVTYAFRLTCAEEEMERRIRTRNTPQADWELERFRELTAIMDQAAERGDMGYEIDTTHRSIRQVAGAIWQNIHERVELVAYDPAWLAAFSAERAQIQAVLGELAVAIHHIGSTAVPGLTAKPIIDIMVEVARLDDAVQCIAPLKTLGYCFLDYPQNTDRRFFRKGEPRTHHLHIVEQGSVSLKEHLAFRDALRAQPDLKDKYAELKAGLAGRHQEDRASYSESKTTFVQRVACSWLAAQGD